MGGEANEYCEVTYVPSRNINVDSLEGRGAIFSARKGIYQKQRIEETTHNNNNNNN
jgi:hypothetical protein